MYKFLLMMPLYLACSGGISSNSPSPHQEPAYQAQTVSLVDSLVPPAYDAGGALKRVEKTDAQWKKQLTADQYNVLRQEGTERAFSGKYWDEHRPGTYICAACGLPLFDGVTKFESGTGWPSFYQPLDPKMVRVGTDNSHGMTRDEVECARCGGHLGHVFNDGPQPTGLRYCMNSVSMKFLPKK